MSLQNKLQQAVSAAILNHYQLSINDFEFQATRPDFEGDVTLVVFSLLRHIKGNPIQIGETIGTYLKENNDFISDFNVVKGFLNIIITDAFYNTIFHKMLTDDNFGISNPNPDDKAVMVEYSSPNTNKPLHLGHIRNNLLGFSVAKIIEASGKKVIKTQIINDRGIHICKSMLAWQKFGNGETPTSTGLKGDKLVGNYYVKFEEELKKEAILIFNNYRNDIIRPITVSGGAIKGYNDLIRQLEEKKKKEIESLDYLSISRLGLEFETEVKKAIDNDYFLTKIPSSLLENAKEDNKENLKNKIAKFERIIKPIIDFENKIEEHISKILKISRDMTEIMGEVQMMLRKWEAGDTEVVALWKTMNQWVYDGFAISYKTLGVDFDINYYESNTYLLGKDVVQKGLDQGVFYKKEDGSVWIDLTAEGLDEKIVLRADGTAVYMTQDIGTAIQRFKDYDINSLVYTVGNEQDYHFKVLFLILKKLGFDWADKLYHLSYGMVDLPSGKMKSREGTVVDADDLVVEMTQTAKDISEELGKLEGYSTEEKEELYKIIGLGALKYFILKVDPKKRILFDPAASIDFNGNTGPFIQYTYARIQSILRKATFDYSQPVSLESLNSKTKDLIKHLQGFTETIVLAATNHSPALIANYTYELVKRYNTFYQTVPILGNDNLEEKTLHVQVSKKVAQVIKTAFGLLGIDVPERM